MDEKIDEKKIVSNFLKLLVKNNTMAKAGEIVALAENIILKKRGNKKIILETARIIDSKNAVKSFTKKGDVIQGKINSELIAGLRVVIDGEKQLDYSLKHKLDQIF